MIRAIILGGGWSRRMGQDKGLMLWQNTPMVCTVYETLKKRFDQILLSIRSAQKEQYGICLPDAVLVCDAASLSLSGPLKGILTVHQLYPADDLLVIGCDMPMVQVAMIDRLIQESDTNKDMEVFTYVPQQKIEPLLSIYRGRGLKKILEANNSGNLKDYSLKHALGMLKVNTLEVEDRYLDSFTNFNSPEDLG